MAEGKTTYTELVDYLHPALSTIDFSRSYVKVVTVTLSVVASTAIYYCTQAFFAATLPLYGRLRAKEKVFWNLSTVRGMFGVFCIVVGVWSIFANTALEEDVVFATTPSSYLAMCITVGFFIFECTALTVSDVYFGCFSHLLHLHHWISLFGFSVVVITDAGHTLGCKGLVLEMSTPFSCLCWTLLKAGQERSLLWKCNQFLLVHAFHLRNVAECMVWYVTYWNWEHIWGQMPLPLFSFLYLQLTLVTFFLTPYWTLKKTQQFICPVDWNFERQADGSNSPQSTGVAGHLGIGTDGSHGSGADRIGVVNSFTRSKGGFPKED